MNFEALREQARNWRANQEAGCERSAGYVVIFNGQVVGWKRYLDNPQGWEPGCLAVSPTGSVYQAEGGNAYDGAQVWQRLDMASPAIEHESESLPVFHQALKTKAGRTAIEKLLVLFAYGDLDAAAIRSLAQEALTGELLKCVIYAESQPFELGSDRLKRHETQIKPMRMIYRRLPLGAGCGF